MNDWVAAGIAVAAAIVLGSILARVTRSLLSRDNRPEALQQSAGALASLVFSIALILGLVVALGFVNEEALDQLPQDLVDYIPRALSAAIVLIAANIVATVAVAAAERSLGHVSEPMRRRVPALLKGSIFFAAGLIAANQLGVDTTILTLAAAAVLFGAALTAALVAFSGSGPVSSEMAAARALRGVLKVGDRVESEVVTGTISEMFGVKLEVETDDGDRLLVPYSELLTAVVGIERPEPTTTDDEE
ncbi:MAG: hypothetical protein OES57_02295 [Acidimicrobiia bacterium]|nr:hypothetical protein [Acidimicrobiia bacterium]